jgi:hypothetical protein
MMTRSDLTELSRALEGELVLSVYLARENDDPGMGAVWRKRLEVALDDLRSDLEGRAPAELSAFERATGWVTSSVDSFGRVLPHEGWCALATENRLWLAEPLPFRPQELVRWRVGATVAPYLRALKSDRPAVLAVLSGMHADVYRYAEGRFSEAAEVHAEWPAAEAADVGMSKRASTVSGVRGATRTDYVKRTRDENRRRHRKHLEETLAEMAGEEGVIVLGGTQKAISAVRKDLEAAFAGRIAEAPELAFDTAREELFPHLRSAVSRLTEERQNRFLDECADPHRGCVGWNETYRALAAGAVDTLLLSRGLIESSPDDAERLVRLALAQRADVEEVGGELGDRLAGELGGTAARLRFVPASLQA